MRVASIQFIPWDKSYYFNPEGFDLKVGDDVVVNTEFGFELGRVNGFQDLDEEEIAALGEIKPIDHQATREESNNFEDNNLEKERETALKHCRQAVKRNNLDMKIVDCYFSFDGQKITFAFLADGRIDFRELVKELNRHFLRTVRLHQIGVRDEAKTYGDAGPCGRKLCCKGHLKKLGSVTSDLVELQQVEHRGAERLSGICGRFKCCLAYEKDLYQELAAKLPAIGTRVRTKSGRGEIVGWHVLRGSVDVKIDSEKGEHLVVEVMIKK